jgi:hypothetical protein
MSQHNVDAESAHVNNALPGETWRFIPAFEAKYYVSSFGRVTRRRGDVLYPVSPHYLKSGYTVIRLSEPGRMKLFRLHRLVMWAFVGECPAGLVVNHKDGDKRNNRLDNLEYVTLRQNTAHALRTGLSPTCERSYQAKLTKAQVREIRRRKRAGETMRALGKEFGVTHGTIGHITSGKTWRYMRTKKLVRTPDIAPDNFLDSTAGLRPIPTDSGGIENGGGGGNGVLTVDAGFVNIERQGGASTYANGSGTHDLGENGGGNGGGLDSVSDSKSAERGLA